MRHVFCFHPSLKELQRAGSVCVMKLVLVLCFHTLRPAAGPPTAASSHVLVHDSDTLAHRRLSSTTGSGQRAGGTHEARARLRDREPFIKHAKTQTNTSGSVSLHKAHFRIKGRQRGVFLIPRVLKQNASSVIYLA